MAASIFKTISDFVLEPALLTTALLALPGLLLLVLAGVPPAGQHVKKALVLLVTLAATFLVVTLMVGMAVHTGRSWLFFMAWPLAALCWTLAGRTLGLRRVAPLVAIFVIITVVSWAIDTFITARILFE